MVESGEIQPGDEVVVRMGTVIPFDGIVTDGEAMVNQASLTGESVPVCKKPDSVAYAGTVVEEGEITIRVKTVGGSSRYDKIVTMIEESEKLKSSLEGKAEHLGRQAGTVYTWRNSTHLSDYQKCYQGTCDPHGRFFMRSEACNADFCTVRDP